MKNFIRWTLALTAVWTLAQWQSTAHAQIREAPPQVQIIPAPAGNSVLVTIHADGHCEVERQEVISRPLAEQQVRMMEWQQKMEDQAGGGDDDDMMSDRPIPRVPPQPGTNSLPDDQLKEKYKDLMSERMDQSGEKGGDMVVTVDKDNLTAATKSSFASIRELLQDNSSFTTEGIYFENVRFEQDTNSHLVVTLTPNSAMKRNMQRTRNQFKMAGVSFELKLVFPGKVLSSGFPETQTNATWITVDSKKDETYDALVKLYDGPIVITAEAAGLTLKEPLDSKNLRRRNGGQPVGIGDDLPITVAGPGFVAEAFNLTTTTVHIFPGASNLIEDSPMPFSRQSGTMIQAKLFPPKGRTLQSVTDLKLLAATDDKGRPVSTAENDGQGELSTAYVQGNEGNPQQQNLAQLQLHLQLPKPDAEAIEEISGEAVAVTAGTWKEMTLNDITEKATNEFDIGAALPGAKLVITKFSNKNNQVNLQVRIKGPDTVRNLKVQIKTGSENRGGYSNANDMRVKTAGGETTRDITINASVFNQNIGRGANGANPAKEAASFQLLLRYPQDLKRERVNFKLKGLDLL